MSILGRNETKQTVAVLGPGGVGGFLAAVCWKAEIRVHCIARKETAEIINRRGILFKSVQFGDFSARPTAAEVLGFVPDVLLISVKAPFLADSLNRIDSALLKKHNCPVLPLLNGIEHMERLRKNFGDTVIAGSISIETTKVSAAEIVHSSPFARINLAHTGALPDTVVENVISMLSSTGIEVQRLGSEKEVLWGKLVRLNALAITTAASGQSIGFVRTHPLWRARMENCVREGSAVATQDGVFMEPDSIIHQLDNLPPLLKSSMLRDREAGRIMEVDAIAGAIIRRGRRYGLHCPALEDIIQNYLTEKK